MSNLHDKEGEAKLGRGELRKPGDFSDQPGQGSHPSPPDDDNERDKRGDYEREPRAQPGQ